MIAFVTIGTNNLKIAKKFYDEILFPFNIKQVVLHERYIGYAKINNSTDIKLYIIKPFNKEKATIGNGTMVTFLAESKKMVDQFHAIGLQNKGINEGVPGPRHGKDYYAYLRDLDGNKICAYLPTKIIKNSEF